MLKENNNCLKKKEKDVMWRLLKIPAMSSALMTDEHILGDKKKRTFENNTKINKI